MSVFPQGINFLNTVLSIGVFLGFTLTAFLLIRQSHKSYANIFLALVVLCYVLFILPGYLFGARLLDYFPHLANIGSYLFPLLGPLVFFYTKSSTQKPFKIRAIDAMHLLPFVVFVAIRWNDLTLDGAVKVAEYIKFLETGVYPTPIWERITKILLAFFYFLLSVRLTIMYKRHISETSTYIDNTYSQWLLFFSSVLLIPLLVLTIVIFTQYSLVPVTLFAFSFTFFIIMIYLAALFKPELFHRFPNQMALAEEDEKKKYENSNLQEAQKERMLAKLLTYVETEKPYLEPELTLSMLSEQIDIPSHYLSQIINEKTKQSFGDFINRYRVEKAKILLADEKNSDFTILSTAYSAGFNSKSAFYSAFKKFTNTTPSVYRKMLIVK